MAKTKCVSLCLRYIIYMLFSLLFIFSLSQSAYTWGFGLQGRSPLRQSSTKLTLSSSAASGAAQPPRPQGASFRRKREPRGVGEGRNRCKRHALKRWFGSGEVSPDGLQGRSTCRERSPSLYKKSEQAMYSLLRHESKDLF